MPVRNLRVTSLILLILYLNTGWAEEVISLSTRGDVRQNFLLVEAQKPSAAVILFAGGHGNLDLSPFVSWGKNNFLVRSRQHFSKQGLAVAVMDAPSDRKSRDGMLWGFRTSGEHVQDIDEVISWLRNRYKTPVWLIGTSRGTESAAYAAIHSRRQPDGLVLTSSVSEPNIKGTAVTELPLEKITIPTLVIAHEMDGCRTTPPRGAKQIYTMLTRARKKDLRMFSGGNAPQARACEAMSYHGFLGIEGDVVRSIANFIKGL